MEYRLSASGVNELIEDCLFRGCVLFGSLLSASVRDRCLFKVLGDTSPGEADAFANALDDNGTGRSLALSSIFSCNSEFDHKGRKSTGIGIFKI